MLFAYFPSATYHTGCQCTATVCTCYSQPGTGTTITTAGSNGNQIVVVIDCSRDRYRDAPDLKIEPLRLRVIDPPPRYQRRPRFRFQPLKLTRKTEVRRVGRERGHAVGHSPRRRSRH